MPARVHRAEEKDCVLRQARLVDVQQVGPVPRHGFSFPTEPKPNRLHRCRSRTSSFREEGNRYTVRFWTPKASRIRNGNRSPRVTFECSKKHNPALPVGCEQSDDGLKYFAKANRIAEGCYKRLFENHAPHGSSRGASTSPCRPDGHCLAFHRLARLKVLPGCRGDVP